VSICGAPHTVRMTDPRERLAQAIRARRLALGLATQRAAREAGVDRTTWIEAEAAKRGISDHTAAKIERQLQWRPGSIDEIRRGGEPTDMPAAPAGPAPDALDLSDDEHRRLTDEIARIEGMRLPAASKLVALEALLRAWERVAAERDASRDRTA
jgi:transcriptional regulator with XRE-family HTH domain